nr:hypothetical protein Iba_chr02bCG9430 [Ipomoea batatas]
MPRLISGVPSFSSGLFFEPSGLTSNCSGSTIALPLEQHHYSETKPQLKSSETSMDCPELVRNHSIIQDTEVKCPRTFPLFHSVLSPFSRPDYPRVSLPERTGSYQNDPLAFLCKTTGTGMKIDHRLDFALPQRRQLHSDIPNQPTKKILGSFHDHNFSPRNSFTIEAHKGCTGLNTEGLFYSLGSKKTIQYLRPTIFQHAVQDKTVCHQELYLSQAADTVLDYFPRFHLVSSIEKLEA